MTNFEHLSQVELSAYRDESVEISVRHQIGRHLLKCPECRERLPLPTVEQFWAAIMTENELDGNPDEEITKISIRTIFPSFWNLSSKLVWSGGTLMILTGLSFVIWFGLAEQSNLERDIAEIYDSDIRVNPNELKDRIISPPVVSTSEKENAPQLESRSANSAKKRTVAESEPQKEISDASSRKNPKQNSGTKVPVGNKKVISATRGATDENCSEEATVLMETGTNAETVQLRWRKIPNAVKYHLYVSDDEEILVDEYETERETVYVLKKPLDPAKTYKWKIIITLENGQTIVGDAQKFRVKDLRSHQEVIKRQKKFQVRCSANN